MKNTIIQLLILFLFSSCGKYELQETFVPFVRKFEEEIGIKVNIKVVFPPGEHTNNEIYTSKRMLGSCVTVKNSSTQQVVEKYVEINPHFWLDANATFEEKEFVLYHELAHCLLNRGHIGGSVYSSKYGWIPKSMMKSSSFGNQPYYKEYRSYYIQELKNRETEFNET
jgi:hypothetical protein